MAQIADDGGGGKQKGKKRAKKGSTYVDMTPMVDLAFLLLTFFVMTSTFSKPKVMSLAYPAKPKDDVVINKENEINNAMTFLISEDRVFYYYGQYYPIGNPDGKAPTELTEVSFKNNEVRKLLQDRNRYVIDALEQLDEKFKDVKDKAADTTYRNEAIAIKSSKQALKVLVKTDDLAKCKNFIDLIDELKIANIGVIAPVDILASELELLKAKMK